MLQFATLVLNHPNKDMDGVLHIPVLNFPILPIESGVQIIIPGVISEGECGDFIIMSYTASNLNGSHVYLEWDTSPKDELVAWGKLLQHAYEVETDIWCLGRRLDFGIEKKFNKP